MNSFEYVVYYDYNGASACDPIHSPKEPDEVLRALSDFPSALQHCLSNDAPRPDSKLKNGPFITVRFKAALDETATDDKVKHCLKQLGLVGRRVAKDER